MTTVYIAVWEPHNADVCLEGYATKQHALDACRFFCEGQRKDSGDRFNVPPADWDGKTFDYGFEDFVRVEEVKVSA